MHCSLIRFTAIAAFASYAFSQDCFFPNGDLSGLDTACNPNSLVSTCCFDGQACLSNGLCVSDPHDTTIARLHRGTCTDRDWKSGNCPRHCLDVGYNGVPVHSCNVTGVDSYCCFDNCQCLQWWETFDFGESVPYTITIIGEDYTQSQTSSSSIISSSSEDSSTSNLSSTSSPTVTRTETKTETTISTSTSTPAPTTTSTSTASPNDAPPTPEQKTPSSIAIGVGVGVGVGAALLIGAAAAFFIWRRSKRNTPNPYTNTSSSATYEVPANEFQPMSQNGIQKYAYYQTEQSPTSELPANGPLVELGNTQARGDFRRA